MDIVALALVVVVIIALVAQLERTERRRRGTLAAPYLHPLDRDAQRVHSEVTLLAQSEREDLAVAARRRQLAREWTRHA